MNNKKRVWAFTKKELEFFFFFGGGNLHHRLENYFKEQPRTFLERNKYSPHNINQRYELTYVFYQSKLFGVCRQGRFFQCSAAFVNL